MLSKGSIVRLSDNREYYVAESVIYNGCKYYYLATTDGGSIDIMFVSCDMVNGNKQVKIVSDESLLATLTQLLQK